MLKNALTLIVSFITGVFIGVTYCYYRWTGQTVKVKVPVSKTFRKAEYGRGN